MLSWWELKGCPGDGRGAVPLYSEISHKVHCVSEVLWGGSSSEGISKVEGCVHGSVTAAGVVGIPVLPNPWRNCFVWMLKGQDPQTKLLIALQVSINKLIPVCPQSSALPWLRAPLGLSCSGLACSALISFVAMEITQLLHRALPSSVRY